MKYDLQIALDLGAISCPRAVLCDYCGKRAVFVTGKEIHPAHTELHAKHEYQCKPCHATAGCYPRSARVFGRLANAALRRSMRAAHKAFASRNTGNFAQRLVARRWLSKQLGLSFQTCHIEMMNEAQCARVVALCKAAV